MENLVNAQYLVNAVVFSAAGLVIFAVSFVLLDVLTPKVSIWRELVEKQNLAVGVFLGAVFIGMAMIISAAVHG